MSNPNQQNQSSFMDPKTILAIVLCALVFMGWNSYIQKKYPKKPIESTSVAQIESVDKDSKEGEGDNEIERKQVNLDVPTEISGEKESPEKLLHVEDERWAFDISSQGMGIKNLTLKKYFDREKNEKHIGDSDINLPFETNFSGQRQPLNFEVESGEDHTFIGTATKDGLKVVKTVVVNSETYTFDTKIRVLGSSDKFDGLKTYMVEPLKKASGGGLLNANRFDIQEFFVTYGSSEDREHIKPDESQSKSYQGVISASVGEQYFAQAFVDKSEILPDLRTIVDKKNNLAQATVNYPVINKSDLFEVSYIAYMGPKSLTHLEKVSDGLTSIINFGFFSFLAKPILWLLSFIHGAVGNWGLSIILLTILVRFMVLPLHLSSYKSMRNMAKLSPMIKEINEKYKSDPKVKQQKLMEVYSQNKVNPIGGCLPMLLQLPVFFALYQVLGQSIELYQAPFLFWINDLSSKDPLYVLPVLMGITMFVQMKTQPSTMDDMQKKIMMVMPVMFTVFMLSLPSGLTLYIFISGLFGIVQQYLMRDKSVQATTAIQS